MALCEKGADFTLIDIEGNTPKDLANKSGHTKCAKYLNSLMKERQPMSRQASENIAVSAHNCTLACQSTKN